MLNRLIKYIYNIMKILYRLLRKMYNKIVLREFSKKLEPATLKEKKLVEELKKRFLTLSIIDTKNLLGTELAWASNMNRLRKFVLNEDPREFLQWDVIRNTMFVGNSRFVIKEMNFLRKSGNFEQNWKNGIIETNIGSPTRSKKFMNSSGNLIHHAYHLQQFEERTNVA